MTPVEICCGSGGGFSTKRDRHSERRLRSVRIISGLYMDAWGSIFMGSHRPSLAVCLSSLLVALQQVAVYRCVCVFCVCVNDGPVKAPITRLLIKEQFICLFPQRHSPLNTMQTGCSFECYVICSVVLSGRSVYTRVRVCPEYLCLFVCRSGSRVWGQWFTTLRPTTSVQWHASRNSECNSQHSCNNLAVPSSVRRLNPTSCFCLVGWECVSLPTWMGRFL